MTLRTRSFRLFALLLVFRVSSVAFAQSAPPTTPPSAPDKTMKKLSDRGTGKGIKVTETDGTQLRGVLVSMDATGFQIALNKATTPTRIEYTQVKSVGATGLSTGAKVGIGILIGVAIVIIYIFASLAHSGL